MDFELYLPNGISFVDLISFVPVSIYRKVGEELTQTRTELEEARQEITGLNTQIQTISAEALASHEQAQALTDEVSQLKARLEEATRPPVPALPSRIIGFTIENSKVDPSAIQYAKVRKAMDWGLKQGFNLFRMFLNPKEMRDHMNPESTLGNLINYGQLRGLRYMADTMDTILRLLPDDAALKSYCDAAKWLGCEGFYINDADDYTLDQLTAMAQRLRKACPTMPIYASLMANANLVPYKRIFDRVEIQTFGSDDELGQYLKRDAIPCLDLRKYLTVDDLRRKANIIAQYAPRDFFFYADLAADYDAMPDAEDLVIRALITKLKAS